LLLTLSVIVLVVLGRTPYSASNLEVSDAVQYAVGAFRFALTGTFAIPVEAALMPPRYPPWFSTMILEPIYQIPGAGLGDGIVPVTLLALVGVVAAFKLGKEYAGILGGSLAALALTITPEYRHMSRIIWSDGPTAAFSLVLLLLFVAIVRSRELRMSDCLAATAIAGAAGLFRFTGVGFLAPFLIPVWLYRRGLARITGLLLLGSGAVVAAALSFVYNQVVFGDPFRSGYHVWVSVPYDFPGLLFNLSYIPESFLILLQYSSLPGLVLLHLLLALPGIRRTILKRAVDLPKLNPELLWFSAAMAGALLPVFLPYYYFRERFLLPMIAPLAVLLAIRTAHLLKAMQLTERTYRIALSIAVVTVVVFRPLTAEVPFRRDQVEAIRSVTPKESVIVSALDPVYLKTMLPAEEGRQILPLSRTVEIASKLYTPLPPGPIQPPPRSPEDHLAPGLLERGSFAPITVVALSESDPITKHLHQQVPVFLESSNARPEELELLRSRFTFTAVAPYLYRIGERSGDS
jgi:hypothetical protein